MKEKRLRFRWKQRKVTRVVLGATTKPVVLTKKRVLKIKMRNLRYLQMHPDRVLAKVEECHGDYFPPHILAIENPVARECAMSDYAALYAAMKIQRRYKKRNCQSEMSILKQSKDLGLFPKSTVRRDSETKLWEANWKHAKREKAERRAKAKRAANARYRKNKRPVPYAEMLLGKIVKPRRFRKSPRLGTFIVKNNRMVTA